MGGRATLVQSVLSVMSIYSLSLFLILKKTCDEIMRLQRIFLWGGNEEKSNIPWNKWEWGLGIRDIRLFNVALVEKWIWRYFTEDNRLWINILKSKYGGLEGESGGIGRKAVGCRVGGKICGAYIGGLTAEG
ncbi:hypothetical protein ACS0TY_011445 [Phlomoides rotata]